MSANLRQVIGRLPDEDRHAVVYAIGRELRGANVSVEYGSRRNLGEAKAVGGTIVGPAFCPGSAAGYGLVLDRFDGTGLIVLNPAHLIRIRNAAPQPDGTFVLGGVVAGPALKTQDLPL